MHLRSSLDYPDCFSWRSSMNFGCSRIAKYDMDVTIIENIEAMSASETVSCLLILTLSTNIVVPSLSFVLLWYLTNVGNFTYAPVTCKSPGNCWAFDSTFEGQGEFLQLPTKIWAGLLAGHKNGLQCRAFTGALHREKLKSPLLEPWFCACSRWGDRCAKFFFIFFIYLPFLMSCLLRDGWTWLKYCSFSC